MVFTGLSRETAAAHMWRLLCAHGLVSPDGQWELDECCPAFDSVDAALEWCEAHFLEVHFLLCVVFFFEAIWYLLCMAWQLMCIADLCTWCGKSGWTVGAGRVLSGF